MLVRGHSLQKECGYWERHTEVAEEKDELLTQKKRDHITLQSGRITSITSQPSWARQAKANGSHVRATASEVALHQ